ncbi:hemerythrin HHE cation binding domain-containing protein [Brevirhabdus pacifica]|nr:hemerythrin domain-containing protein [Brevirhabdus pacifica]PJJ86295.1 hemerythrin HHE cation binding domain-containing protein [Brevirhabdus pacifica]
MMESLPLRDRDGLPDALRTLLADYPREAWEQHPQFTGLVQFWLERHMMFRQLEELMGRDLQAVLERQADPAISARRLGRFGGMLVQQLNGHHQIEDLHYFPLLTELEPRLERGFEMLERDHDALDGLLAEFAREANSAIVAMAGHGSLPVHGPGGSGPQGDAREGALDDPRPAVDRFASQLESFRSLLERHLLDEEDLVVPVILAADPAALA